MPHPGRNSIYDAAIRRMVREAIEAREQEFARDRGNDSDGQLLAYLQFCARLLGHTPWPREITGGCLIENRFGSWERACQMAGLPRPVTPDKVSAFSRYQEEEARQKQLYRERKAAKKQRAQARMQARKEKQISDP